ncbi:tyrosine-type recombinase/integrase [Streptomyces sp. NPDC058459]|uniref:tyrosine-type recombinase/integrase n=1 Tax=Streptomyces sp. NPDC058459 TaxID=3346508 RepID=UPI003654F468
MDLTTAQECAERWGLNPATVRRVLAQVDSIDRDPATGAMRYDRAAADAARAERPGRGHRADLAAEVVEPEEIVRLTNDDAIPAEHRALWALLWEGDLRVGDALALDVRDVDLDEHKVDVDYPKTDRDEHVIPLSDQSAALALAAIGDRTDGPLFVNQRGRALSRESVARFARQAAPSILAFCPVPQKSAGDGGRGRRDEGFVCAVGARLCRSTLCFRRAGMPDCLSRLVAVHLSVAVNSVRRRGLDGRERGDRMLRSLGEGQPEGGARGASCEGRHSKACRSTHVYHLHGAAPGGLHAERCRNRGLSFHQTGPRRGG